ncbi:Dephospho-CoA kinase [Cryptosporidium felis]|nr:Dephospho-CoA kinase [Cryptosporidium felis]
MIIPCITGGVACGKSRVSTLLEENEFLVIDMDVISREIVKTGKPAYNIVKAFGDQVLNPDKSLNRKLLRTIIFEDSSKRRKLNRITHPRIFAQALWKVFYLRVLNSLARLKNNKVVLISPLFFENKTFSWLCSPVYVIATSKEQQIKQLMARDSCTRSLAESMINSQMSLETKCKLADKVIWNNTTLEHLHKRVKKEFQIH